MGEQLTLGALIDALEKVPADRRVRFDFCRTCPIGVGSWRGNYGQACIHWAPTGYSSNSSPSPQMLAGILLDKLKSSLEYSHLGWKGGEYTFFADEPVWVDNDGDSTGTYVFAVEDDESYWVTLRTSRKDPWL